jgi:hypothetical protein
MRDPDHCTAVLLYRPVVVTLDNLHDLHRDQPDSGERLRAPDGCLSLVVGSDQVRQLVGSASPSPSIPLSSSRHGHTDAKRQDGRSLAARPLGPAARATQEHSHSQLLCSLVSAASLQSYRRSSYGGILRLVLDSRPTHGRDRAKTEFRGEVG